MAVLLYPVSFVQPWMISITEQTTSWPTFAKGDVQIMKRTHERAKIQKWNSQITLLKNKKVEFSPTHLLFLAKDGTELRFITQFVTGRYASYDAKHFFLLKSCSNLRAQHVALLDAASHFS